VEVVEELLVEVELVEVEEEGCAVMEAAWT
jgi:hypothetical protein